MDKFIRKIKATKKSTPVLNYKKEIDLKETKHDPNIYYIPDGWHFGDYWAATNWFLIESERLKQAINVVKHDKLIEISKELDTSGTINFIQESGNREPQETYTVDYLKTKLRWRPTQKLHYRICYQLDGRWKPDLTNPSKDDINKLTTFLPNYEFIGLGLPFSVHDCVRIASQSDLFIGVSSGMSHLTHSVGTPMFLIEYKLNLDYAHRGKKFTRCFGTDDCIEKVRKFANER